MTIAPTPDRWPPLPTERERRRAMRRMPADPPWDWVRPRVVPVIELPEPSSEADDPYVSVSGPFGMRIGFGVDLKGVLVRLPRSLVSRWQIMDHAVEEAALQNLRVLALDIGPADINEMEHEGVTARSLTLPPANATALILIPEVLQRILGPQRQTLVTISRGLLLSLPSHASHKTVWDYMSVITHLDPTPLQEGPFALEDGQLNEWIPPSEPMPRLRVRVRRR